MKISINKDTDIPIRDQLIEQIALQIASGSLKGKEKLPSIRALAERLGIHYSTVTAAYNHLAETGLLEVRQGSGVRVSGRAPSEGNSESPESFDQIVRDFLAKVSETGTSRKDLRERMQAVLDPRPVRRIVAVDSNEDFHELLKKELSPHFPIPVETMTPQQVLSDKTIQQDSLFVTSLYHLFAFETSVMDPTRLVACNIEPGRAEMETIAALPAGNLVALISVSPTIMRMATKLIASLRADVALRSLHTSEKTEIQYIMNHADLVLCDRSGEDAVKPVAGKTKVLTFKLYSPSTIETIKDRLKNWG